MTSEFFKKQLLIYANDEKGVIIGVGFLNQYEKTDFVREWKFPELD